MCGIAGIFSYKQQTNEAAIRKMTDSIKHRGPDAEGFFVNNKIALGHRRLSIIDLSENANQPIYDSTGNYAIIFNGEIYNYKQVKAKLTNYHFKTNSDTEVVLAAYLQWGAAALEQLVGMFAFAIYNIQKEELFIARDRLGVKPVYYFKNDNNFIFASELRAIIKSGLSSTTLDEQALVEYFTFQSFSVPHTLIQGVKQLEPGHYITITQHNFNIVQYWSITQPSQKFEFTSIEQVQANVKTLLNQAVQRRLVADVPVAAFLSGGIDSSAVVGLMAQHTNAPETFNIAFAEKEYDESGYAEIIAKKFNTKHHKILLKPEDFLQELPNALDAMDIPSGDGVNSYVVSKAIVNNGIKVAMSGVGGDELFAGYPSFKQWHSINQKKWLWNIPKFLRLAPIILVGKNHKTDRIKKLLSNESLSLKQFYTLVREVWSSEKISQLTNLKKEYSSTLLDESNVKQFPILSQFSIAELLGYTHNTLLKDTDQFSMAVSLEVREPFFDHELIEYVLQIPDMYKYPSYPKKLLVESLGNLLPSEIVHRKKQGFTFPWAHWMRNELYTFCDNAIHSFSNNKVINKEKMLTEWKAFKNGNNNNWQQQWLIVVLQHWVQKNGIDV